MSKNKGFASLAALQTKIQEAPIEEIKEPLPGPTETATKLEEVTQPVIETPVVAPAQPVFDDEPVVLDPTERLLNELSVVEWTTEELEQYIGGLVTEDTYLATIKAAIVEHRIREQKLSQAWSLDECRVYFSKGIVPAKTSKGAWVNDITRRFRREHEWETNELESWALGEVKPEGSTLPSGLAIELKQRLNLQVPGVDVNAVITNYRHSTGQALKAFVEQRPEPKTLAVTTERKVEVAKQIQLEGLTNVNQSYIESSLAKFEAVMRPGRAITETTAGEAQKLLRDVIVYSIGIQDPAGARSAMQFLLEYFRARRADGQLFEDTYAFRGIPDMRSTKKEQVAHHDLLTLFLVYADPMVELRQQTDIPSLVGGVAPQLQSRVLEFFSRAQ